MSQTFSKLKPPSEGQRIQMRNGALHVPDMPIIPLVEGDGIGPDIAKASRRVFDAAVEMAYGGSKEVVWLEVFAGEKANSMYGELLPKDTVEAIRHFMVAIKGPLTTPVAGGFRSLNVTLRQVLDLFACVRPVKYIPGVPSRFRNPEDLDLVIFRESSEDVYAGIEYEQGSKEAEKILDTLRSEMGVKIESPSAVGIKPISEYRTKRIVRAAINYALRNKRRSLTIMHKGNIMKYTEGAFRNWAYEVASGEFGDRTVRESEVSERHNGKVPVGKLVVKDRMADNMFPQLVLRLNEYDVIVAPNLNGDYLSDFAASLGGGLGLAPGANINYDSGVALFEATHGSAPKYTNQDIANPTSLILTGAMMFDYIGWDEATRLIEEAVRVTISKRQVTNDLARQFGDVKPLKTSEYASAVVANMKSLSSV